MVRKGTVSKRRDVHREGRKVARRVARAHDALAARLAELRRVEEEHARTLAEQQKSSQLPRARRKTSRALLIINSKSGPNNDSILRVREVVERLRAHGIEATVRVKLRKKQARKDARKAAKKGYPLVIAAGGDGTVASVAEGLVGTDVVLGVVPLGTYNNVATSLGVPVDLEASIALIASGLVRAVDVGLAVAAGATRPRIFMEMALVGVTAALMPAGQEVKQGRWQAATETLPTALSMSPTEAEVRLDGAREGRKASTLLIEIANAPRIGPGVLTAPDARVDDGLLDVAIYHGHTQAALAARFVALKTGMATEDPHIERVLGRSVEVQTANSLPVVADAKVIGRTPARFDVMPGSLLVAAGRGIGLAKKPEAEVVAAGTVPAPVKPEARDEVEADAVALATPPAVRAAGVLKAATGLAAEVIEKAREILPGKDGDTRTSGTDRASGTDGDAGGNPSKSAAPRAGKGGSPAAGRQDQNGAAPAGSRVTGDARPGSGRAQRP